MANTILITANWHTGALSQQTISRQYDNNRYAVRFVGYPEASDDNELDYYLLVWMSSAPGEKPDEIAPIQLASDQWYISNVFTQQTQQIKFQMCALNTEGTYEAHSPIFTGFVRNSLEHDGTTQDIDVSTLFDAYREYLNELIIRAGAVVIDPTLSQSGQAADAKAVGDEITGLKEDLNGKIITETLTADIPTSIVTASSYCTLSLADYTGKKAFISNKNLFPLFPSLVSNGITLTPNADGSITLSGTSTSVASFQLSRNVMPTVGNGTFTLSANNTVAIGDDTTYINPEINDSYGAISCKLNSVDATETFTLGLTDRITAIRIRISSGVTLPENYKLYIQLEEGAEKTAFVPHDGSIIDITEAETQVTCFKGYNYVAVQRGVSGTVTYLATKPTGGVIKDVNDIKANVESLNTRVTALEQTEPIVKKFTGKKIVCFGDSITGNFPAPTDYPSMIADITGATVYNAGFGGCCMCDSGDTADQPRRLFTMCRLVDSIVAGDFTAQRNSGVSITYAGTSIDYVPERLDTLESIDWSQIDYITIAYGTNDWNSNYGLDNADDSLDTTTYIGAFRYSIEKLLEAYPNIKVMVITPLWRWWDTNTGMPSEIHSDYIDSNDYAKGTGYKLWQYGDALKDAAKLYHIPVFDLYWNCMMFKKNRLEYFNTTDGTHPKLEGRELMAELISAHMESVY